MTPDDVKNAVAPYTWGCSVNGGTSPQVALLELHSATTVKICEVYGLPSGEHQLTFQTVGTPQNTQILLDYLEYEPAISATPQSYSFVAISADDPAIGLSDSGWSMTPSEWGIILAELFVFNSSFEYSFTGKYIKHFSLPLKYLITGA